LLLDFLIPFETSTKRVTPLNNTIATTLLNLKWYQLSLLECFIFRPVSHDVALLQLNTDLLTKIYTNTFKIEFTRAKYWTI